MKSRIIQLIPILSITTLAGCGSTSDAGTESAAWLGEETHFALSGTFQGTTYDVRLTGEEASSVYCNRFYTPLPGETPSNGSYSGSQVYFAMKEVGAIIDVDGVAKEFTFSYWRHDVPAGVELEVVPRTFGAAIPEGKTWSDINVFAPGENILSGVESAAATGVVKMMLNTGTPEEGVMVPSGGRTGELITASWGPRETLEFSATAECTTLVVEWARDLVAP